MTKPHIHLERTSLAQSEFNGITSEIPVVTDPFEDDTPITAVCDLENPESCESCQ